MNRTPRNEVLEIIKPLVLPENVALSKRIGPDGGAVVGGAVVGGAVVGGAVVGGAVVGGAVVGGPVVGGAVFGGPVVGATETDTQDP